jgi:hypothetical protein
MTGTAAGSPAMRKRRIRPRFASGLGAKQRGARGETYCGLDGGGGGPKMAGDGERRAEVKRLGGNGVRRRVKLQEAPG